MRIRDRNVSPRDYGAFGKCSILRGGKMIRFTMAGGAIYDVPVTYFRKWYDEPHYVYANSRWVEYRGSGRKGHESRATTFTKCRRVMGGRAVRVYIGNHAFFVPWDTVLMACERNYEHFGGLTEESRQVTLQHHRVAPDTVRRGVSRARSARPRR